MSKAPSGSKGTSASADAGARRTRGVFTPVYSKQSNGTAEFLETETVTLAVRVPIKYKMKYKKMTHRQKYIFKMALMGLIDALASGGKTLQQTPNLVLNLNINVAEAKAEAKPTIDAEVLQEKVRILEAEKKELKDAMKYYKKRYEQLASIVKKMPDSIGEKYVDYRKLSTLLTLVKKAKETVSQ